MPSIPHGQLRIDAALHALVAEEIAPGTGVDPNAVWSGLEQIIDQLAADNQRLLDRRDALQDQIDTWFRDPTAERGNPAASESFLRRIGYLFDEPDEVTVVTSGIDPEIGRIAGPQLVVPVDNARYCLNAANARWGSLYDALYGTDVLPESDGADRNTTYNPVRGARVVEAAARFLDQHVPLDSLSHAVVTRYQIAEGRLQAVASSGDLVPLRNAEALAGYRGDCQDPSAILFRHNSLHIEITIDRENPVGSEHPAGVCDVLLESAVTTIQDCEDSVSAVDAADKIRVYRNWLGLMKGDLSTGFTKGGRKLSRRLAPDREYTAPDGSSLILPGRSLMLVRNVGIHMMTDAVTTADGAPVPEGFLDALITSLAAIHDLKGIGSRRNSRAGSIYIVKPKMHGPEEVAHTVKLFTRVEEILGLPNCTLKIGIMDEERRTTVNLKSCIAEAANRLIFINTGFLDRTGDEIHTAMEAGPVLPKPEIKGCSFMSAYEDWNVDIGLETEITGHGQIGKGMWAMPDRMKEMVEAKSGHPRAGANCAWVPSPTAATLHAMHYHEVDVTACQDALRSRPRASLAEILTPPLLDRALSDDEIGRELENNAQGILGYVVRWIDQGIGCSKVPDLNDVGLMEDRATLRISSQHIANWLHHGIVDRERVVAVFQRMAAVVDRQNADDPAYRPMAPEFTTNVAFQAALDLVLKGREEANGYTERVLHRRRREEKRRIGSKSQ